MPASILLSRQQTNGSVNSDAMKRSHLAAQVKRNKQARHGFKKLKKLFLDNLQADANDADESIVNELHRYAGRRMKDRRYAPSL
jgi:hypothetical protein